MRWAQVVAKQVMKLLQFARYKDLKTLQVYIDQAEDAQGKIVALVAMGRVHAKRL
ncbi:hypothetical protein ACFL2Q_13385 [Thermodesulfobacteriota bacterium]